MRALTYPASIWLIGALAATVPAEAAAPNLTTLYSFGSTTGDGQWPVAGVITDASGALYGTTGNGGNYTNCLDSGYGCGTVFKLAPPTTPHGAWRESVLYSFAATATDGMSPFGGLIMDSAGALYGTTFTGGTSANCSP